MKILISFILIIINGEIYCGKLPDESIVNSNFLEFKSFFSLLLLFMNFILIESEIK